jgi:hypothetical protein
MNAVSKQWLQVFTCGRRNLFLSVEGNELRVHKEELSVTVELNPDEMVRTGSELKAAESRICRESVEKNEA